METKKRLKKLFPAVMLIILAMAFFPGANNVVEITVWSYTDEVKYIINNYVDQNLLGIKINYVEIPTEMYDGRLDDALAKGRGLPDLVVLEVAWVRKYVESEKLLDLSGIYRENRSKLLAYPAEVGTFDGTVYAMAWQQCAGAMFYRRSLARKYLGTDNPREVQSYFNSKNRFLETAQRIKERSNGTCQVVPGPNDLLKPFLGGRNSPWIVNGRLVIDPIMEDYMDVCKELFGNGQYENISQWSQNWFSAMQGRYEDRYGKTRDIFSYFMPGWGLHYVLKTNAPETSGDWAMIQGPFPWYWGGTWLAGVKTTKNPDAVRDLIRFITTDDAFHERYAQSEGDLVTNLSAVSKAENKFSEPFLARQNHYAEFTEMAKKVNGKLTTSYDRMVENCFENAVSEFIWEGESKRQVLADFREEVEKALKSKR